MVKNMNNEKNNVSEQLDRLEDELIDNIINTNDFEILKEIEEDYGDSNYEANKFREILKKSKISVGKKKLSR